LWYVRYADDFLLGFVGPKAAAETIKRQLAEFLWDDLELELRADKTLITHARDEVASFLGYEVHALPADDKHDWRGQRCINGALGLRVRRRVITAQGAKYRRHGKPTQRMQCVNDSADRIVARYQAEYRGIVQYYRLAYNLHELGKVRRVAEASLVKTLAKKDKTTRTAIYRRFRADQVLAEGTDKVLAATVDRGPDRAPLRAHFGAVPLQWNKWVAISETVEPIWSGRSEVVDRLLAQTGEVCGATDHIEVHHIRRLADLRRHGRNKPAWVERMAARRRKTLVVCQRCHHAIQYGRYDGPALSGHRRAT